MSSFELPETFKATTDPAVALKNPSYVFHAIPIQASKAYLEKYKDMIKV